MYFVLHELYTDFNKIMYVKIYKKVSYDSLLYANF